MNTVTIMGRGCCVMVAMRQCIMSVGWISVIIYGVVMYCIVKSARSNKEMNRWRFRERKMEWLNMSQL